MKFKSENYFAKTTFSQLSLPVKLGMVGGLINFILLSLVFLIVLIGFSGI